MPGPERTWFEDFWRIPLANLVQSTVVVTDFVQEIVQSVVPEVMTLAAEAVILSANAIGAELGNAVKQFEARPDVQMVFLEAVTEGINDLFGTNLSPHDMKDRGGGTMSDATFEKVGEVILGTMFGQFGTAGELTPDEGRRQATKAIGFSIQTAIEGWASSIVGRWPLNLILPNWADLDDLVSRNLGLGTITAQLMKPLLEAAIVTPWEWDLRQTFRPALLRPDEAVKAWVQGTITEDEFFEITSRYGFSRELAATFKILKGRFPFKEDIARMIRLGMYDRDQAVTALRERGFLPDQAVLLAEMYDRLGEDKALQRTRTVAADMYRDLEIDEPTLRQLLQDAGAPGPEVDAAVALGNLERSRPRSLPRSVAEKAYDKDVWGLEELRIYYQQQGYSAEGIGVLEKLAILDKTQDAEKLAAQEERLREQEERAAEIEEARARAPRSVFENAYIQGEIRETELRTFYEAEGFSDKSQKILLKLAKARKKDYDERVEAKTALN